MEIRSMKRVLFLFILATLTAGGVGCTQQRAVHLVKADGDRAFENRQFEAAAVYYAEAVDRRPGDWQAQYQYGLTLLELDRPNDARRALEIASAHRPGDRSIRGALARAMYEQGATNDLFSFLRQEAAETRDPNAYLELARYSMELGDMDAANQAILTAIEFDGGKSVEPYLVAAEFHAALGHTDQATRRLRQAYGIDRTNPRVNALLREYGEVPGPTLALPPGR